MAWKWRKKAKTSSDELVVVVWVVVCEGQPANSDNELI